MPQRQRQVNQFLPPNLELSVQWRGVTSGRIAVIHHFEGDRFVVWYHRDTPLVTYISPYRYFLAEFVQIPNGSSAN